MDGLNLFIDTDKVERLISKIITEKFMVPVRLMAMELNPAKENENLWIALVKLVSKIFITELYLSILPEYLTGATEISDKGINIEAEKILIPRMKEIYRQMKLIIENEKAG